MERGNRRPPRRAFDLTPRHIGNPLSINGEGDICGGQGQGEGGRELLIHDFCSEDAFSRFVGDELGVVADRTAESDFF